MKVAIVGSRDFPNLVLVREFVLTLPPGTVVVSGGARGVDNAAVDAACMCELAYKVFRADWETHGKAAGFMRNSDIVENADVVVAFWDGESPGTLDTIKKAVKAGKKVTIYGPTYGRNK